MPYMVRHLNQDFLTIYKHSYTEDQVSGAVYIPV